METHLHYRTIYRQYGRKNYYCYRNMGHLATLKYYNNSAFYNTILIVQRNMLFYEAMLSAISILSAI